jgi:chromosome segregation ATPase
MAASSRDQSVLLNAARTLARSLRRKLVEERVKTQIAEVEVNRLVALYAQEETEHRTLKQDHMNAQLKQFLLSTKMDCFQSELARVKEDNSSLRKDISSLEAKVECGEKDNKSLREDISRLEAKVECGEKDNKSLRGDNKSLRENISSLEAKVERGEKKMEKFIEVLARHGIS